MWMGQAFVVNTQQSGPRGEDRFYSANWGMLGAARTVGKGAVVVRAMVSLEPATVRNQYYPLLFQTGDAAMGAVAFPHRASAMETPQATLGHHWLDATHIVNNAGDGRRELEQTAL